jgi:hypothetical protein
MERGSFSSRMHYSMANPIKEPNLEKLVQFLRINIKMDGKSSPSMSSVAISPAFVISPIDTPNEKTHPVATIR